jgi:hypothetical protein
VLKVCASVGVPVLAPEVNVPETAGPSVEVPEGTADVVEPKAELAGVEVGTEAELKTPGMLGTL